MPRTVRLGDGPGTVEVGGPQRCPNGHLLEVPNLRIGWLPCSCAPGERGHRTYRCETCHSIRYDPPHDDAAEPTTGQWVK